MYSAGSIEGDAENESAGGGELTRLVIARNAINLTGLASAPDRTVGTDREPLGMI
jgi:hypothetical protein